jgi:hypothetical protein
VFASPHRHSCHRTGQGFVTNPHSLLSCRMPLGLPLISLRTSGIRGITSQLVLARSMAALKLCRGTEVAAMPFCSCAPCTAPGSPGKPPHAWRGRAWDSPFIADRKVHRLSRCLPAGVLTKAGAEIQIQVSNFSSAMKIYRTEITSSWLAAFF